MQLGIILLMRIACGFTPLVQQTMAGSLPAVSAARASSTGRAWFAFVDMITTSSAPRGLGLARSLAQTRSPPRLPIEIKMW